MAKKYISKYTGPEIDSGLDNIPKLEGKLTELESDTNKKITELESDTNKKITELESDTNKKITELESEVNSFNDILSLCDVQRDAAISTTDYTPIGSTDNDLYLYATHGEKFVKVKTATQYGGTYAITFYNTSTPTKDGYMSHHTITGNDRIHTFNLAIPGDCKLVVVCNHRPFLAEPTICLNVASIIESISDKTDAAVKSIAALDSKTDTKITELESDTNTKITELESEVNSFNDILSLCDVQRDAVISTTDYTPIGSTDNDLYLYATHGEKFVKVKTATQYGGTYAITLYNTSTPTKDGYMSHHTITGNDRIHTFNLAIPGDCKLVVVCNHRPFLAEPTICLNVASIIESISDKTDNAIKLIAALDSKTDTKITELESETNTKLTELESQVESAINGKDDWTSLASITLYPGISTSSAVLYPFSKKIEAGKSYLLEIDIQNNAIPRGAIYFKNEAGSTIGSTVSFTDGYTGKITFTQDIVYASFSLTDSTIVASGDIVVKVIEEGTASIGLKERVEVLERTNQQPDGSALETKEIISISRPYYFAQGWEEEDEFGYLDNILNTVPKGSHFLLFSDIHVDYHQNWGLQQKQSIIMRYIQQRLRHCPVVFLGDFLGAQSTEAGAQKVMSWFADEYYSAFGAKFIPTLGDHDTDRVNGGLAQGEQLTEEFIYKTYFEPSQKYNAVVDTLGIDAIDNITFSDDVSENERYRLAWKNYMRMHYYVDDPYNKLRIIVIQNGAKFRLIPSYFNTSGVSLPFVCQAMNTAPNDYHIVILSHEFDVPLTENGVANTLKWEYTLFSAMAAYKNRREYIMPSLYTTGSAFVTKVWNAVIDAYGENTYLFDSKKGSIICLQGDEHYDYAGYYDAIKNMNHYASEHIPSSDDILRILIDRACLPENAGFPVSQFSDVGLVLNSRRAVAETSDNILIGSTAEVLFDIVTINDDGVTITRVGDTPVAGRIGLYPIFNESENYDVGDRVVWYEITDSLYMVKLYEFITSHTAGQWNDSEVTEIIVDEPYVRHYVL